MGPVASIVTRTAVTEIASVGARGAARAGSSVSSGASRVAAAAPSVVGDSSASIRAALNDGISATGSSHVKLLDEVALGLSQRGVSSAEVKNFLQNPKLVKKFADAVVADVRVAYPHLSKEQLDNILNAVFWLSRRTENPKHIGYVQDLNKFLSDLSGPRPRLRFAAEPESSLKRTRLDDGSYSQKSNYTTASSWVTKLGVARTVKYDFPVGSGMEANKTYARKFIDMFAPVPKESSLIWRRIPGSSVKSNLSDDMFNLNLADDMSLGSSIKSSRSLVMDESRNNVPLVVELAEGVADRGAAISAFNSAERSTKSVLSEMSNVSKQGKLRLMSGQVDKSLVDPPVGVWPDKATYSAAMGDDAANWAFQSLPGGTGPYKAAEQLVGEIESGLTKIKTALHGVGDNIASSASRFEAATGYVPSLAVRRVGTMVGDAGNSVASSLRSVGKERIPVLPDTVSVPLRSVQKNLMQVERKFSTIVLEKIVQLAFALDRGIGSAALRTSMRATVRFIEKVATFLQDIGRLVGTRTLRTFYYRISRRLRQYPKLSAILSTFVTTLPFLFFIPHGSGHDKVRACYYLKWVEGRII